MDNRDLKIELLTILADGYKKHSALVAPVRGVWCSDYGRRTPVLGSGKVAGKVLIVDHM